MAEPPDPPSDADGISLKDRLLNARLPARSGYKTPPNSSAAKLPAQDTPFVHQTTIVNKDHGEPERLVRDERLIESARALEKHTVGPMPVKDMFKEFLTPKGGADPSFKLPAKFDRGAKLKSIDYKTLVDLVKKSGALTTLKLCDTHKKRLNLPYTNLVQMPDWTIEGEKIETFIEDKPTPSDDPWNDRPKTTDPDVLSRWRFMKPSNHAMSIIGQLKSYAEALFELSPRTHVFTVIVFGTCARLMRWDRAGCVVSERFNIVKTQYLYDFLHRYQLMSPSERGHDSSVTFDITDEEKQAVQDVLEKSGHSTAEERDPEHFRRISFVVDRHKPSESHPTSKREFIFTCPRVYEPGVEGAATREGLAVMLSGPKEDWTVVYLKDGYRDDDPEIMKEGDIYELLHAKGVRNIPVYLCSGDAEGEWQQTQTDRFVHLGCPGVALFRRKRYCLVLGTIGRPLSKYESAYQLTEVVNDALVAHSEAFEKAGLLHRNISPGNILITDGGGVLTGWQFAKTTNADRQPRAVFRVGNLRFHSYALCLKGTHDLRDDLESFFWVYLYMFARYRPLMLSPSTVLYNLDTTFNMVTVHDIEGRVIHKGGDKKLACLRGDPASFGDNEWYKGTVPPAVRKLFLQLRALFRPLYPDAQPDDEDSEADLQPVPDNGIPDVPVERYHALSQKLGRRLHKHEYRVVSDAWAEEYKNRQQKEREALDASRSAPSGSTSALVINVIDYEPVNSHTRMLDAFEKAVFQPENATAWLRHNGPPAEDQVPGLRQRMMTMEPNTSLTAGSFASFMTGGTAAPSGRSKTGRSTKGSKRAAEEDGGGAGQKRARRGDVASSSLSTTTESKKEAQNLARAERVRRREMGKEKRWADQEREKEEREVEAALELSSEEEYL